MEADDKASLTCVLTALLLAGSRAGNAGQVGFGKISVKTAFYDAQYIVSMAFPPPPSATTEVR